LVEKSIKDTKEKDLRERYHDDRFTKACRQKDQTQIELE
jgi:hypothetical protein